MGDKMGIIENILDKVDPLLIAGGMGSTFLKSLKYNMGQLTVEEETMGLAQKLVDEAGRKGVHLLLPIYVVVADRLEPQSKSITVSISGCLKIGMLWTSGEEQLKCFYRSCANQKRLFRMAQWLHSNFINFRRVSGR